MISYLKAVLRLPKGILFFIITEIILGIGLGMWSLSFNLYLSANGISTSQIGRISSAGPLTTALLAIICGYVCDKIGYKKSIVTGCLFKVAGMFLTYCSGDVFGLYLARVLNGTGDAFILVSEYPYITAMVADDMKSTVYSIFFSTTMIAGFFGNIAAGALKSLVASYGAVLLASCLIMAVIAVIRLFLPDLRVEAGSRKKGIYLPKSRDMFIYFVYNLIGYAVYFFAYSMLNLILKDYMGLSDYKVGLVSGILLLGAGVSTFFVPLVIKKVDRSRLSIGMFVALAVLYVFTAFSAGFWFVLLILVTGFMQNMLVGLIDAPMLNSVPEGEKGGFSGLKFFLSQGGNSLGVLSAGLFLESAGSMQWIYIIACMGMIIQVLLFSCGFKRRLARIT